MGLRISDHLDVVDCGDVREYYSIWHDWLVNNELS